MRKSNYQKGEIKIDGINIKDYSLKSLRDNISVVFQDNIKRRRRDLNPRAAINDLLPFQGSPFGQLGYFSITERVGFEPTRPFGQTVFKTASL